MSNIVLNLTPTRVIGLSLTAPAQGSIDFAPPSAGLTLQLAPFFKGDKGDPGEPGTAGSITGGAGIVVVGTEIRLSIGTLPQVG